MAIGPVAVADEMMAGEAAAEAAGTPHPVREWPSTGAAYWALFVIIFATFLTFFDQTVFGMLAERIKHDFGLTDSQLGFLPGPPASSAICSSASRWPGSPTSIRASSCSRRAWR